MRVSDVQRQFRYWSRFPTTRDMVASYLGITEAGARRGARPQTEEEFIRAMTLHGVGHG